MVENLTVEQLVDIFKKLTGHVCWACGTHYDDESVKNLPLYACTVCELVSDLLDYYKGSSTREEAQEFVDKFHEAFPKDDFNMDYPYIYTSTWKPEIEEIDDTQADPYVWLDKQIKMKEEHIKKYGRITTMTFKEWLLANWDNLRKDTKHFSDDDHKVLDLENNSWWVNYSHEKPLDSWDRLFALYLIDVHPECVNKTWDEVKDIEDIKDFSNGGYEGNKAYDNYEREWLSSEDAWDAMTHVAKKGKEVVLVDSFYDGGWFGAS